MKHSIADLLHFLDDSPTAWHAVENVEHALNAQKFVKLEESDAWKLAPGGRYFVTRNGSSIAAFILPQKKADKIYVAAAHTDSPALKLKPNSEFRKENMVMLGVEVYGGPLLNSWLNRDLAIAGRVAYLDKKGNIQSSLVNLAHAPVVIPQLAIHLDREINEKGLLLNKQDHLPALAALNFPEGAYLETLLKKQIPFKTLLGHDLFLYPLEKAKLVGPSSEMFASYRIDNLGSVHAALTGFLESAKPSSDTIKMIIFWDNEEVGSSTAQGAESPFFSHTLERILIDRKREDFFRILSRSLCLSVDEAHALHPNYANKHDPEHQPLLGGGIVLKHHAQQRYATDADGEAYVHALCLKHQIPVQTFVSRGDVPCGSTIGPIHAKTTGMKTIDIGCPQLSMHAARELAACEDHLAMCTFLKHYFQS